MPDIIDQIREASEQRKFYEIYYKLIPQLIKMHDEGLIPVLPCKPGQQIYAYSDFGHKIVPYTVEQIHLSGDTVQIDCNWYSHSECMEDAEFELDEFGETVFITREAAENALKERET